MALMLMKSVLGNYQKQKSVDQRMLSVVLGVPESLRRGW